MKKKTTTPEVNGNAAQPIIQPIIRNNGEKHILEEMFEAGDDLPEIVSVGYMRLSPNSKQWVSYTITSKGHEVIKIEVSEPDQRAIASESAKIAFVNTFEGVE